MNNQKQKQCKKNNNKQHTVAKGKNRSTEYTGQENLKTMNDKH